MTAYTKSTERMHKMIETPCGIINITDRKSAEFTGVNSVDSFDEYTVNLSVSCGTLTVEGEKLSITVLDLDKGKVCVVGRINSVSYSDEQQETQRGLFSKLFGGK